MGRHNNWLDYLHSLSDQGRDLTQYTTVCASQWAHDVRCVRQGTEHRRVGESASHGKDEWLEAGFAARQFSLRK